MTDDANRQVREVLKEVYAAWEANDADAFAKPYAESATATLPGIYLSGRQAIRDAMAALLAGQAEPDAASRALETWVLSRPDGTWLVQAFHNGQEQVNRDAE